MYMYSIQYIYTGNFEKNIIMLLKFCNCTISECDAVVKYKAWDLKVGGSNPTCSTYFCLWIQTILEENSHWSLGMCMWRFLDTQNCGKIHMYLWEFACENSQTYKIWGNFPSYYGNVCRNIPWYTQYLWKFSLVHGKCLAEN